MEEHRYSDENASVCTSEWSSFNHRYEPPTSRERPLRSPRRHERNQHGRRLIRRRLPQTMLPLWIDSVAFGIECDDVHIHDVLVCYTRISLFAPMHSIPGARSFAWNFLSSKNEQRTDLPPKNLPSNTCSAARAISSSANLTNIRTASSSGNVDG